LFAKVVEQQHEKFTAIIATWHSNAAETVVQQSAAETYLQNYLQCS
jgi:hypothetical protein